MQKAIGESGYAHAGYAHSLAEFGHPRLLPASGGWVLEREIPGSTARDAMGCYPIFACRDWSRLAEDLDRIDGELVSLVLVTDPFGDYSPEMLRQTFQDSVIHFKDHFVADLREPMNSFVSKHHQYYAARASEQVKIERCDEPERMLDEWSRLYDSLVARHELKGMKAFSRPAFAEQLAVPGMVVLRATHAGETVGAHLWYVQGEVAYSHLTAASVLGYSLMSAYALSRSALEIFAHEVRWIDWGAGAGLETGGNDGLSRFKRGWANGTRAAYLCGRIFDRASYEKITRANGLAGSRYFPAYRAGELS